jgi:hypothetical protein
MNSFSDAIKLAMVERTFSRSEAPLKCGSDQKGYVYLATFDFAYTIQTYFNGATKISLEYNELYDRIDTPKNWFLV